MNGAARPLPSPTDAANLPHWVAAGKGQLMVARCDHCGVFRFPATRLCAHCRRDGAHWEEVSGQGVVESFCVFHKAYWPGFAAELPYTVLVVRLDEGVRLYSNPAHRQSCPAIGQRVRATFASAGDGMGLVLFRPDEETTP